MRKKLFALLAACALVLSACSAGGENYLEPREDVLVYATLSGQYDRGGIDRFNSTHEDVRIEVRDYSGDTEDAPPKTSLLLAEIAAGKCPDIIEAYSGRRTDYWLPYEKLAKKGCLEELWTFIENDPELGRDKILEAPLKTAEVDGGLYMIFDCFAINTFEGAESVVGDRTSWTLAELRAAFSTMPEGSTVSLYTDTKEGAFQSMMFMSLDSYVDWETGTCFFDSEEFRSALEFINSFPMKVDIKDVDVVNEEIGWRLMNGFQMLRWDSITSLLDLKFADVRSAGAPRSPAIPSRTAAWAVILNFGGAIWSCPLPARTRTRPGSLCGTYSCQGTGRPRWKATSRGSPSIVPIMKNS